MTRTLSLPFLLLASCDPMATATFTVTPQPARTLAALTQAQAVTIVDSLATRFGLKAAHASTSDCEIGTSKGTVQAVWEGQGSLRLDICVEQGGAQGLNVRVTELRWSFGAQGDSLNRALTVALRARFGDAVTAQ